ncbi:MAG: hypothetical protein HMLIMOIP_001790 [Candidatus Nitrosomirales archaeon]|jgi:hypothetical protein
MRFAKTLASMIVVMLFMSAFAIAFPADAQSNTRTQINLGIKKSDNPSSTSASGADDFALPSIVRVGETHFVNGRLVQIEGKSSLSGLANAGVKLIDVFNNAQNPLVLATAITDKEGYFVFEWQVHEKVFEQLGVYKLQEGIGSVDNIKLQILAKYDGDADHASSTSRGYIVELRPLRFTINVTADKQMYSVDEVAEVRVTFKNPAGEFIDPDALEIFFDSTIIPPTKIDVGSYFFVTPALTEKIHLITVIADKEEYLKENIFESVVATAKLDVPVAILSVLDQREYGIGDFVEVSGDVRPAFVERAVLFDIRNPNGVLYNVGQVFPNEDGKFDHQFKLGGTLAVPGKWSITTTYLGQQTSSTFDVGTIQTKFMRIGVELPETVDQNGDPLGQGNLGTPIGIQSTLTNNENRDIKLTYIIKVTDSDGVTAMVSWIKGSVNSGMNLKPTIFWIPDTAGNYNIDIFVWDSLDIPIPLSAPAKIKIGVV